MTLRAARSALVLLVALAPVGCGFRLPYTTAELRRDASDRAGKALVHYLTQHGADSGACRLESGVLVRFTSDDFAQFVRGLERGDVPPSTWAACERNLVVGLRGASLHDAAAQLAARFADNLDARDDEPRRLWVLHALAVALDMRPVDATVPDESVARIGARRASGELGSYAQALSTYVSEGFEMSRGHYRGVLLTQDVLAEITDVPTLRRLMLRLPTPEGRQAARARLVDVALAASPSEWVQSHAAETRARVLETGRNALDADRLRSARASCEGALPGVSVAVEQDVGMQSARLLSQQAGATSVVPAIDLRERLRFRIAHVDGEVTLCGPAEALDVTPCVDSAALQVASPLVRLDEDGALHVRDELSVRELGALLEGASQLTIPLALGARPLCALGLPLRVLAPEPILYEHGESLDVTLERRGSRIAVTFGVVGAATSMAFVEASDHGAFSITTRGARGRAGADGRDGAEGSAGADGTDARCPSSAATDGASGGRGGDGSDGEAGGSGGRGGDVLVTLVCTAGCDDLMRIAGQLVRTEGGAGGPGGEGGDGGRGGRGGEGGDGTWCSEPARGSGSGPSAYLGSGSRGSDGWSGSSGRDGWAGASGAPGDVEYRVVSRAEPR